MVLHVAVVAIFRTRWPGPLLSDCLQFVLGALCVRASYKASQRSDNLGRHFWRLMMVNFSVWLVGQAIGTFNDSFPNPYGDRICDVVFVLATVPLGMALF